MTLGDIIQTVLTPQLLLLFFMTCWLLVLLCPREWYPRLVAILVPVWCATWWLMTRPVPSSDDWSFLGRALMTLGLFATLGAAGLRNLVAAFAKRRGDPVEKLDWEPARTSILVTVVGATVLEFGPDLAHRVGALATVASLVVLVAGSSALALHPKVRKNHHRRAGTVAVTLFVSLLLIAIWPFTIAESAKNFARGRPYCILVADGGRSERLASSRWDLSPLIMRASDGHRIGINRHAYLVLGEGRSAHWSYMRGEFVDDPSPFHSTDQLDPDKRCAPVASFVERLPWF
jgi:hypothetical protein